MCPASAHLPVPFLAFLSPCLLQDVQVVVLVLENAVLALGTLAPTVPYPTFVSRFRF